MSKEGLGPTTLGQSAGASDPPPGAPDVAKPGSSASPTLTPLSTGPATKTPSGLFPVSKDFGTKEAWSGEKGENGEKRPPTADTEEEKSPLRRNHSLARIPNSCEDFKTYCVDACANFADWFREFFGGEHLDEGYQAFADLLPLMIVDLVSGEDENEDDDIKEACAAFKAKLRDDQLEDLKKVNFGKLLKDEKELFSFIANYEKEAEEVIHGVVKKARDVRVMRTKGKKPSNSSGSFSRISSKILGQTEVNELEGDTEQGLMPLTGGEVDGEVGKSPKSLPPKKLPPASPIHKIWIEEQTGKVLTDKAEDGKHLLQKCANCGNVFQENSLYCRKCGEPRPVMKELRFDHETQEMKEVRDDNTEAEPTAKPLHDTHAFPWFIVTWTALVFGLWCCCALFQDNEQDVDFLHRMAGLESFTSVTGYTNLQMVDDTICGDLRSEIWRLFTYQFTHVGFLHVTSNSLINIIFGIRLEKLHSSSGRFWGPLRMFIMYNLGVIGGGVFFFLGVVHGSVVGMSAGCYSLLGMHATYLFYNWNSKRRKHKWITLIVLIAWFVIDLVLYLNEYSSPETESTGPSVSYSAHLGGAVTGVFIALCIGENIHESEKERYLKILSGVIIVIAIIFCLFWILPTFPPASVLQPSLRWCWMRHVYNRSHFQDSAWHCVRCKNQACIDSWQPPNQQWVSQVTRAMCEKNGWAYTEN